MNKVILGLILAVCVLGMALIMLNERLGRKSEPASAPAAESGPVAPDDRPDLPSLPQAQEHKALSSSADPGPEQAREEFSPSPLPPLPDEPKNGEDAPIVEPDVPQALPQENTMPEPRADAARSPLSPAAPAAEQRPAATAAPQQKTPLPANQAKKSNTEKSRPEKPTTEKTANDSAVAKAAGGERSISRFVVFARDKGATVRLVGSAPIRYKTMTLTNPERVVVDLEGQWRIKAPGIPKNALVSNVRIGKMADKTRVVIDLTEKPARSRFVLSKDGNTLDVRLDQ